MSWARWGPDSDVYVFEDGNNAVECMCDLITSHAFKSPAAIQAHFDAHIAAGDRIPPYCWQCFHAWIAEDEDRMREAREVGILW